MLRLTRILLVSAFIGLIAARSLAAGSLSGRLLDARLQPVTGVRVESFAFRPTEQELLDESRGVEAPALGWVRTNSDGRFTVGFEKPAGEVSIRLLLSASCRVEVEGPFDSNAREELDDLVLPPVSGEIAGQVVDEAVRPVSRARLELQFALRAPGAWMVWKARTDTAGTFEFSALPEGSMNLIVRAPGLGRTLVVESLRSPLPPIIVPSGGTLAGTVVDPSGAPVSGAVVVAGLIAAETNREGHFRMAAPAGPISLVAVAPDSRIARSRTLIRTGEEISLEPLRLSAGACIGGQILDEVSRKPVAGARIAAARPQQGLDPDPLASRSVRCDSDGRFRVCGLDSGPYRLEIESRDHLAMSVSAEAVPGSLASTISLALRRGTTLSGRVVDEQDKPVGGVRVSLHTGWLVGETASAKDGRFRLRRLEPAVSASIDAEKSGYVRARVQGIALRAGLPTVAPDLILRRGLVARGGVVDPSGESLAGVEIRAAPESEKEKLQFWFGGPPYPPDAVSDTQGRFELSGLEPGEYRVVLWREGFADRTVAGLAIRRGTPNEWAPIVLTPGVAIDGHVISTDGKPISGAQVSVFREPERSRWVTSDEDGFFHIEGLAPRRPVSLWASAEGFVSAGGRNVVPPTEEVTLTLVIAAELSGRLVDYATKEPIRSFKLTLIQAGGSGESGSSEDFQSEEGRFVLRNISPGSWSVRASAPGYPPAIFPVSELASGETREGIVLSIRKGLSVSGRVSDTRGKAIANARVACDISEIVGLRLFGLLEGPEASTDAEGRFRLEGLRSGTSALEVSHPGFSAVKRDVDPDIEPMVEIVLETGGRITGRLIASGSQIPVVGEEVKLWGSGHYDKQKTDIGGSFAFENLANGSYEVSAAGVKAREVSIQEGRSVDDLILERKGEALIRGAVSGLPPSLLGLLRITASGDLHDYYHAETATDEQGHFVLRDVPPGTVRVGASTQGLRMRSVHRIVEIPEEGAEVSVELVFEGSSCASGRVTRAGRPAVSLSMIAESQTPESPRVITLTDDRGFYELEGLVDGDYRVFLGIDRTTVRSLRVQGDTVADYEMPTGSLRGRVQDAATGAPLSGVRVRFGVGEEENAPSVRNAVTDVEGSFEIGDLEPGTYPADVEKAGYKRATVAVKIGFDLADVVVALQPLEVTP